MIKKTRLASRECISQYAFFAAALSSAEIGIPRQYQKYKICHSEPNEENSYQNIRSQVFSRFSIEKYTNPSLNWIEHFPLNEGVSSSNLDGCTRNLLKIIWGLWLYLKSQAR